MVGLGGGTVQTVRIAGVDVAGCIALVVRAYPVVDGGSGGREGPPVCVVASLCDEGVGVELACCGGGWGG